MERVRHLSHIDDAIMNLSLQLVENFANRAEADETGSGNKQEEERYFDPEDSELVKDAKRLIPEAVEFEYDERDVIVYNMGVGATEKELQWVYEGDENFGALPTFGVCPQFASSAGFPFDWLPNFNPVSILYFYGSSRIHITSVDPGKTFAWRAVSVN
jgi:multifunctional beta-oxidation protein